MAKVKQLPAKLSLECIAGDPLTVTVTSTGATITLPTVTLVDRSGAVLTDDPGTPAVSQDSAVTTVAFSGADTLALAAYRGVLRWSLSATVDGGGPYEIIADTLTIRPVGTAGVATESTAEMAVTVDGAAVALTVALGGTGGGGAVDSVNGATGVVVLDAGDIANTPAGSVAAVTVQAAIDELDGDKIAAATLTTDGDIVTRAAGVPARITRASLAADTAFTSQYQPLDSDLTTIATANNGSVLAATTASFTTADESKLDGIEAGADVTDTTNVTAAGALMDSEVDVDIKTLSLPANTTISAFGATLVDDADQSTARTTLGLVIGTNVQAYDADTLKADTADTLTAGFDSSDYAAGTKSSGTYTPAAADGNFQVATNGGAHTLAPPSTSCSIVIHYTNNGSAGTITTSGFTAVTGDAFTTTDTHEFVCVVTKINDVSVLNVTALQ